ncbi:MAG: MinD/ParA family protein [Spirochaetia bacterium]|nr:MinD/ParA family protein [Spirochaetia bacterium]
MVKEIAVEDLDEDQAYGLRRLAKKKQNAGSEENDVADDFEVTVNPAVTKKTRVITITSGKGGVGKSSVSVNLALTIAKSGKKVLLFDADLGLANINVMLGVIPKYNLYHVVKGSKKLNEIIIKTPEGLDLIAGASGYSILANLNITEREKLISEFEKLPYYDIMIIDTGAGVGANVIGFTLPADEVLVITTPEPTSITDAYGIIKSIVLQSSDKNIKLLVNRVSSSLEAKKVLERVVNISNQFLNVKVDSAGYIFEDEFVSKSIRQQKPFILEYPKSKASACLQLVAGKILNQKVEDNGDGSGSLGKFFSKLFG